MLQPPKPYDTYLEDDTIVINYFFFLYGHSGIIIKVEYFYFLLINVVDQLMNESC